MILPQITHHLEMAISFVSLFGGKQTRKENEI